MKVTKKNAASTGHKQGCLIPRELENHEEIMKNDSDRKKKSQNDNRKCQFSSGRK